VQAFLNNLSAFLIENYKENLERICIVLPNRRGGLFLKKYLGDRITKPVFAPEVYSIEDFVVHHIEYGLIDNISLLFELYEVHKIVDKDKAQDFDEFMTWGKQILIDFNELDQYLVDAESVFNFLNEAKAIELWNPEQKELTSFEKNYLQFYNSLAQYYKLLNERLTEKGNVYQGLIYRLFIENIDSIEKSLPYDKIVFAGFNALTKAEEQLIGFFIYKGKAKAIWDTDDYYMYDKNQESGLFLRQYEQKEIFRPFIWREDHFKKSEMSIDIIGVPGNVGQAKVTGELLQSLSGTEKGSLNTALVLNDEKLFLPVLNSIPEEISDFNVTMGLPLKYTPLFELIDSVMALQENMERFSKMRSQERNSFYMADIYKVMMHPFMLYLTNNGPQLRHDIQKLISSNKVFYSQYELEELFIENCPDFYENAGTIFKPWNNTQESLNVLIALNEGIRDAVFSRSKNEFHSNLELEYLYHFALLFRRLLAMTKNYPVINTIRSLRNVFRELVNSSSIPFYGEPLKGIQVMGMLETRTLDFESLIMTSVNEDILPASGRGHSFIPFDIRKKYGLPTYRERNAVFAYHFYRLLQRAKKVYLLYNTEQGELGGGDKSRFISQLLVELREYNSNIIITEKIMSIPPSKDERDYNIQIKKDKQVINRLKQVAERGISPSGLNRYRNCSLKFYFQDVMGIREERSSDETVDSATLGIVIHDVLAKLFKPFLEKELNSAELEMRTKDIDVLTQEAFSENYQGGDISFGKNMLIATVARTLIRNYVKQELIWLEKNNKSGEQTGIDYLEETFYHTVNLKVEDSIIPVKLLGKIDRVDHIGNVLRIIDYKNFAVTQKKLKVVDWEDLESDEASDLSFQLLFYSYLIDKNKDQILNDKIRFSEVRAGVISIRKPSRGMDILTLPGKIDLDEDAVTIFDEELKKILFQLFKSSIPFVQTEKTEICEKCQFKAVCNR